MWINSTKYFTNKSELCFSCTVSLPPLAKFFIKVLWLAFARCGKTWNFISLEKYFVKATYSVIQINPQISHNFCNKNCEGKFLQFLHCVRRWIRIPWKNNRYLCFIFSSLCCPSSKRKGSLPHTTDIYFCKIRYLWKINVGEQLVW